MAKLVDHPVLTYVRGLPAYQQLLEQLREGGFKDQERFGLGLPRASRLAVLAGLHVDLSADGAAYQPCRPRAGALR